MFGRTPRLAFLELTSCLPSASLLSEGVGLVQDSSIVKDLASRLGGTVKVAEVIGKIEELSGADLAKYIDTRDTGKKIVFGVSVYGIEGCDMHTLLRDIKQIVEKSGHMARYVASHEGSVLSSVVVTKQHVQELIAVRSENGYIIGKTLAVQEFEEWSKRDYGRPYADPKSGMLPPKVARMLVHAAVGVRGDGMTILDPFCGMATILAEALLEHCRVIGGDQDPHIVSKARRNLEWLATVYRDVDVSHLVFYAGDATGVSRHIQIESVDAIITEPFMGTTKLGGGAITDEEKVRNIMKGLEKLYIGCLREWHKVLKPSGKVVIAFPEYHIKDKIYAVKKVIDMCEKLGYTNVVGPIEYGRPQAIVKRKFYLFEKKHNK